MNSHFQINSINENSDFHQLVIKNTNTNEYISILPKLGARLNAAYLKAQGKLVPVVVELINSDFKTNNQLFNNALLFPFAGRIRKGLYNYHNHDYQLPINYAEEENACHGFLYKQEFEVISKNISTQFAEVELSYSSLKDYQGYPFGFKIEVSYRLNENGEVIISTTVENTSKVQLLFSNGWHPYYKLGKSVEDLKIEFKGLEKIELNEFNVPTGNRVRLNIDKPVAFEMENKVLDDVYQLQSENDIHEIILTSKSTGLVLNHYQQAGPNKYNYLVLYTPPEKNSIAIEPITSNIDSFNNKEDIIYLNPGDRWTASYGFELNKKEK